jgi:hypothetical protein
MTRYVSALVGTGVALLAGCSMNTSATTKAVQVEHAQCAGARTAQDDLRLLETTTVLRAEPIYSHVHTNSNEEDRVSGAKLLIRAPEGVTADRFALVLQCHSARALLGQVDRSQLGDDPYWLPGAWVDIDVTPEAGNFAVTLRSDSVSKNLQVLNRATAFAGTHRETATP